DGQTEAAATDWIYGNIIVDRDIFGPGPDWGMSIHRDGPLADRGVLRFGTENKPPDLTPHTLQGLRPVLDGAWHHVAFVRERVSGIKSIYVDGVLDVASAAGVSTGDLSYPDGRATAFPESDPFLVFGSEKHGFEGTSIYPSFNGWMDEIRVWSVARSAAEIDAGRWQGVAPTTPGLALYLRLEEGSGNTARPTTSSPTQTSTTSSQLDDLDEFKQHDDGAAHDFFEHLDEQHHHQLDDVLELHLAADHSTAELRDGCRLQRRRAVRRPSMRRRRVRLPTARRLPRRGV